MEVKIGIQSIPREIVVDTDTPAEEVENALKAALANGGLFTVRDDRGGKVMVPTDKIGYVELSGIEQKRIGFGSL